MDLGQFGSLCEKSSFFHYRDSFGVNSIIMELVLNQHREMVLQILYEFSYFEEKTAHFFTIGVFSNPNQLKSVQSVGTCQSDLKLVIRSIFFLDTQNFTKWGCSDYLNVLLCYALLHIGTMSLILPQLSIILV